MFNYNIYRMIKRIKSIDNSVKQDENKIQDINNYIESQIGYSNYKYIQNTLSFTTFICRISHEALEQTLTDIKNNRPILFKSLQECIFKI